MFSEGKCADYNLRDSGELGDSLEDIPLPHLMVDLEVYYDNGNEGRLNNGAFSTENENYLLEQVYREGTRKRKHSGSIRRWELDHFVHLPPEDPEEVSQNDQDDSFQKKKKNRIRKGLGNELSIKLEETGLGSSNGLQVKLVNHKSLQAREKIERLTLVETFNVISGGNNTFKKGICPSCSKQKIVFSLCIKQDLSKSEQAEQLCVHCLLKKLNKKVFNAFISVQSTWSPVHYKEPILKEFKILSEYCRSKGNSASEEDVDLVNSILREKLSSFLTSQNKMTQILIAYKSQMTSKEKLLALKLIHDTLDCIMKLNSIIGEKTLNTKIECLTSQEQKILIDEIRVPLAKRLSIDISQDFSQVISGQDRNLINGRKKFSGFGDFTEPDQAYAYLGKRLNSGENFVQLLGDEMEQEDRPSLSGLRFNFLQLPFLDKEGH